MKLSVNLQHLTCYIREKSLPHTSERRKKVFTEKKAIFTQVK